MGKLFVFYGFENGQELPSGPFKELPVIEEPVVELYKVFGGGRPRNSKEPQLSRSTRCRRR